MFSTTYYHDDQIGSSRLMTNGFGYPVWQGTFLPYGEEYQPQITVNNYKFTGKERDSESGLDYSGARYLASSMGRWMSPDWSEKPSAIPYSDLSDPQSLNLYTYVRNNPITRVDEDGHCDWCQKLVNGLSGNGFKTDAELQQPTQNNSQQLVQSQDAARNDPKLQPGKNGGPTHCNAATCQIVKQTGAPLDPLVDKKGNPVNANQQAQNLANSNQYREVTPQEAQQIANNGGTVIVAYDNPNGHGHTATIRPEGVPGDNPPKGGRGPLINDIGRNVGVRNENFAFRKGTEVHYYAPKDKP